MLRGSWALFLFCVSNVHATTPAGTPLPSNSIANAVQVDASGNIYLAGFYIAQSSDSNPPAHAFVAKLSPDAAQTIWWRTIGGSKDDRALALTIGSDNSVYVTGKTASPDFPVTPGVFQPAGQNAGSTFALKLDASGAVVYATYIPAGSGQAIAVDAAGDAFITGFLRAGDSLQATPGAVAGAPNSSDLLSQTAFIVELDAAGSKALLSIIGFGGSQIALDRIGNIYAAGSFGRPSAPTTVGAFQTEAPFRICTSSQIFSIPCLHQHVAKIDRTGTRLIYATYISGIWGAQPTGLAVDNDGNVILAGTTSSPAYPTTPRAYQPEYAGSPLEQGFLGFAPPAAVGFVTKLNGSGDGLVWSTLFGGSGGQFPGVFRFGDSIGGMTIDSAGNVLVAGAATSPDLPGLWNTPVASRPAPADGVAPAGFIARLSPDGGLLSPVELLNGLSRDLAEPSGGAVAVRADGHAVVVGKQVFTVSFSSIGRVAAICDAADGAKVVKVAPGELLTLYGTDLALAGLPSVATSFNGFSVTFNGFAAPLLYTSSTQINLQVPYEIAGQSEVLMRVTSQSVSPPISESYFLAGTAVQPSIFLGAEASRGPLADAASCNGQTLDGLQPLALNADGSLNSCTNPAAAGSTVTVFLNGLGVTAPAQTTGTVTPSSEALTSPVVHDRTFGSPVQLPTFTLGEAISGVAQVQVHAGATSSVVKLSVGEVFVRGPGIVIWVRAGVGQ